MVLQAILINFLSTASPTATFKTTPSATFNLTYDAIVQNKISIVNDTINGVTSDGSGLFVINIPELTEALRITISAEESFFPSTAEWQYAQTTNDFELTQTIKICNRMAIDTAGLDHTAVADGEDRVFGHQLGPHRSSRAMAMVHIAMFEALLFVVGGYQSYVNLVIDGLDPEDASPLVAIIQANYDMLVYLYPSHQPRLVEIKNDLLDSLSNTGKIGGITVGTMASDAVKTIRLGDNSSNPEIHVGNGYPLLLNPGEWRPDPISGLTVALGARWGEVTPFVIPSSSIYRCPAPPNIAKGTYSTAYGETKCVGGDGLGTRTVRSEYLTETGIFWAYDGTPSLCAPPRLYNQITTVIAYDQKTTGTELLHLFTLLNVGMADAGIAAWESKYFYKFWRPITGIREAAKGTGPTGRGDRNPRNAGDPRWTPLGAPASNVSAGVNFTPPFPAYPSGHATFGGALFQILRRYYETDNISFTFVSDELNGNTLDNQGNTRPSKPRTFNTLSQAEEENGQSRMYLGIHWNFDKTAGITQGNQVADYIFEHLYQSL